MVEIATVDELRENLDKYLQMVDDGNEVILIRNGRKLGSIVPRCSDGRAVVKELTGFLKDGRDIDLETAKDEYFREKYGLAEIMTGGV
ncbi:MAG: hypothetical protein IJ576_04610 [Synergistaceae bacterium]|nr:hypothetical protein [Synergistaceae bacterium]MBR1601961.1 hypothetical protein [Synergistaceae bacterium]